MSRKHLSALAIFGILILSLSILGCQGYKAPEYKSPTGEAVGDDAVEEVDIDVSDLGEEDTFEEEVVEEPVPEVKTRVPDVKPAATVKSYKPADRTVVEDEEPAEEVSADEAKKAPYRPIVEENLPTLTVTEGDLVKLNLKATDPDGDTLTYTFTAPLNSEGKWQTRIGDAGVSYPEITVSDGKTSVVKKIKLVVETKNNKPVLQFIANVEVNEGETVTLNPKATDGDGDRLTYTYSGWMSSNTKTAGYKDAGTHKVVVSVTDGISTVSQEVTVTVKDVNRPPELEIEF
jgi:hypothetical protein